MLPVAKERRRSARRWTRVIVALATIFVGIFFWMQYTMLSASFRKYSAKLPQFRLNHKSSDTQQLHDDHNDGEDDHVVHLRGPVRTNDMETTHTIAVKDEKSAPEPPPMPTAAPTTPTTAAMTTTQSPDQEERRLAVRKAMQHAWGNYEKHAFGGDEVDPVNGKKLSNVWGDIACSLVDGMDTLWIMDLKDEFWRARDYVRDHLRFDHLGKDGNKISIFETMIREVGGLLSAFDLSQDTAFKDKAKELVDLMMPAFSEKEGVFYTFFNPRTHEKGFAPWSNYKAHIADVGTLQLELRYMTDITSDPTYAAKGDAFYKIVEREGSFDHTGLFPVHFNPASGKFDARSSTITIGALGDSFYEYLLKVYLYSGKRQEDAYLKKLYNDAVDGIEKHLLFFSASDNLYFLQELRIPSLSPVRRMDHLLCFVPGLLALGTLHEHEDTARNAKHLDLAQKLMETCYQMYHKQPTGLSPDVVSFPNMYAYDRKYRLRPEAIESLFYLWRTTHDPKYRDYGWEIFQNLETHAKTKYGYGAVLDVTKQEAKVENKMESFFLAETLKYHYLLQAPDDVIPLDQYVFNTEAHPLRIRTS